MVANLPGWWEHLAMLAVFLVFGIIERFSEDVDLSFDRAGLGFGGKNDPLNAATGKRSPLVILELLI